MTSPRRLHVDHRTRGGVAPAATGFDHDPDANSAHAGHGGHGAHSHGVSENADRRIAMGDPACRAPRRGSVDLRLKTCRDPLRGRQRHHVIAAIVILTTGYARADAIASLFVVTLMLKAAWGLLRDPGGCCSKPHLRASTSTTSEPTSPAPTTSATYMTCTSGPSPRPCRPCPRTSSSTTPAFWTDAHPASSTNSRGMHRRHFDVDTPRSSSNPLVTVPTNTTPTTDCWSRWSHPSQIRARSGMSGIRGNNLSSAAAGLSCDRSGADFAAAAGRAFGLFRGERGGVG